MREPKAPGTHLAVPSPSLRIVLRCHKHIHLNDEARGVAVRMWFLHCRTFSCCASFLTEKDVRPKEDPCRKASSQINHWFWTPSRTPPLQAARPNQHGVEEASQPDLTRLHPQARLSTIALHADTLTSSSCRGA